MKNLPCFECGISYPDHKMDCSSKEDMEKVVWVLSNTNKLTKDILTVLEFSCWLQLHEKENENA